MKKTLFVCCALALALGAQAQWKPVGDKIKTPWSEQVNPANVLPEYPRPQLERGDGLKLLLKTEYSRKHELRHFIGRFYKMKASTNLRYGDRWKTICECMKSLVYRPFAKETYPILLLALMPEFIRRRIFTIHSYDKVADIKDVKKLIGR